MEFKVEAQANNMKDSGLDVVVGLRKEGKTWDLAEKEGHIVKEVADASNSADIIHILVPDMEQAVVYTNNIAPKLSRGKTLSFSHGAVYSLEVDRPA